MAHQKWLGFEQPNWSCVRQARAFIGAVFQLCSFSRSVDIDTLVATGGTIQRLVRLAHGRIMVSDEIDGEWLSQDERCIEINPRQDTARSTSSGRHRPRPIRLHSWGALIYAVIMEEFKATGWQYQPVRCRQHVDTSQLEFGNRLLPAFNLSLICRGASFEPSVLTPRLGQGRLIRPNATETCQECSPRAVVSKN